ncbi:REP-associated tyrosine transposase [Marinicella meishanensis]|uniref:REP-associated tyrosine transposase n=1 Tax=Marinicella meishanensis TaxID=2873263 RepID=UPI001CC1AFCF|nr:transposase [Marinicella sp. NBU2979]
MPNFKRIFVENSFVFVTAVINNRDRTLLTDFSDEFKLVIQSAKESCAFKIHAIALMPDHFHIIIRPKIITEYPKIISLIKIYFTKSLPTTLRAELSNEVSISKIIKRESGVWQRRFFERTIRDQTELNHLTDYIHYNPVKHQLVEKPSAWRHSSFQKFVKEGHYEPGWCDFTQLKDYH